MRQPIVSTQDYGGDRTGRLSCQPDERTTLSQTYDQRIVLPGPSKLSSFTHKKLFQSLLLSFLLHYKSVISRSRWQYAAPDSRTNSAMSAAETSVLSVTHKSITLFAQIENAISKGVASTDIGPNDIVDSIERFNIWVGFVKSFSFTSNQDLGGD